MKLTPVYEVAAALVAFAAPSPFAALKKLRAAARRHSFYARDGVLSALYLSALRHVAARSRTFGERAVGHAHVLWEAARKALRPA